MPTSIEDIAVKITETEQMNIAVTEEQPINVSLEGYIDMENFMNEFLIHEEPTMLSLTNFQTSFKYQTGHILVFVNGVKERISQVIEVSDREFQIQAVAVDDSVEVYYLRKS